MGREHFIMVRPIIVMVKSGIDLWCVVHEGESGVFIRQANEVSCGS